jgi:hypothetical protein
MRGISTVVLHCHEVVPPFSAEATIIDTADEVSSTMLAKGVSMTFETRSTLAQVPLRSRIGFT